MAKSINRRQFNKLMLASGLSAAALSKSFGVFAADNELVVISY